NSGTFLKSIFSSVDIQGLAGADTIKIGNSGGSEKFINFPITINGGSSVGDTLIIDDSGDNLGSTLTLTASQVGSAAGNSFFASGGSLTYTGFSNGTLIVDLPGLGTPTNTVFVQSTNALATNVVGGPGADLFTVANASKAV